MTSSRDLKHLFFLLVALLFLVLWGCNPGDNDSGHSDSGHSDSGRGNSGSTGSGDRTESTITVAVSADMRGVNELTVESSLFHQALHNFVFFLTLLDEQADFEDGPATFKPRLAESYEFSEDRKTLTFKLRRNHRWSDGMPITAEDVRWTWQAQTHPDVAWHTAEGKKAIDDVEVIDTHTVRFHFNQVSTTQLLDVNLGAILPKHAWSALPFSKWRESTDWFLDHMVASGPFTLESWQPGERIVVKRNEHYFEPGLPRSDRIVFRIVPDRASQLAMLRSGEAHIAEWARPADARDLQNNPDIEISSYYPRLSVLLFWNTTLPLFADKETRQALTLALDRQSIIDTLYHGYAVINESLFSMNLWARNKNLEPWPYDPERSREILASKGWSDSDGDGILDRDGERFSFEILTAAGNELREDILVMVQDQLARVGVEAKQKVVEFNTQLARARQHDFEVNCAGLGISTNLDLSAFFHSDHIDQGYNWGSYSNPEVDRILDDIKSHTDQLAARPLYEELQARLLEDMPITILYEPQRLVPIRTELRNASPNVLSTYYGIEEWEIRQ